MRRKQPRVLLAFDTPYPIPRGYDFREEFKDPDWVTERDVYKALLENGYEVNLLGIYDDVMPLIDEIRENRPDVVFNLAEVFRDDSRLEKNIAWLLEMLGVPYTGAPPSNLLVCNNKALSKEILSFHKIKVPEFYTFYRSHKIRLPRRLPIPLIVKPLADEASRGICRASIVKDRKALVERIGFIHRRLRRDVIAEEFIEGRELYISVLGSVRMRVLPPIEMKFGDVPRHQPHIATYRAKWDTAYRKSRGIKNVLAGRLPNGLGEKIEEVCKHAYRALGMRCYARFDIRVTRDAEVYIIEANANPSLARYEDFAQAAKKANIPYDRLIRKIVSHAFQVH